MCVFNAQALVQEGGEQIREGVSGTAVLVIKMLLLIAGLAFGFATAFQQPEPAIPPPDWFPL